MHLSYKKPQIQAGIPAKRSEGKQRKTFGSKFNNNALFPLFKSRWRAWWLETRSYIRVPCGTKQSHTSYATKLRKGLHRNRMGKSKNANNLNNLNDSKISTMHFLSMFFHGIEKISKAMFTFVVLFDCSPLSLDSAPTSSTAAVPKSLNLCLHSFSKTRM